MEGIPQPIATKGDDMTHSQISSDTERRVRQEIASGQDELNPAFLFQTTRESLLLAIAGGLIDSLDLARRELASRGLDANGTWVGFDRAREIHLGSTTGGDNAAQTAAAEIARRILQIECLDTRNSDGLDFHDVAVWSLRDALIAAFEAGARKIHGLEG